MIRLAVSVEGQTEEEFVKSVLAGHLRSMGVEPTLVLIGRARGVSGGGNVSVERLASDMFYLYESFDAVTSLVDFYGFRGKRDRTVEELEQHLDQEIQTRVRESWDQGKVVSYVQKHEFEGLLFSDVKAFGAVVVNVPDRSIEQLSKVCSQFPTPEDINDSPTTAPSKRIVNVISNYQKRLHGPQVAEEIGLDVIRERCPRFGNWVRRLESLGGG